ncbi:MAG: hypothetical protein SPJ13_02170, partial [Bacteroidales bacterium]|nr:hypothetical protein [Bacteroidales bacterium]
MPRKIENETDLFDDLSFEQKLQLYAAATELFSENKRQLFDRLAQNRTRHVTVVLEDIFQSHNASAV